MDGLPLQAWRLPIQPNSLVAALVTVAKASMMVSVASCINQLKWRHFALHSRKLMDLQLFDNASRGPWGSALLLWTLSLRGQVLVTFGFSLITIVALGMDTSAQQVLTFPLRESTLNNASVELGVANVYDSKSFVDFTSRDDGDFYPSTNIIFVGTSIINVAIGTIFKPYFTCPELASRCEWDPFTTIGICSTFANVTDIAVPSCRQEDAGSSINCTYSFPGMLDFDNSSVPTMYFNPKSYPRIAFQSKFATTGQFHSRTTRLGSFMAVNVSSSDLPTNKSSGDGLDPPPVQVYSGTFSWCAQTFHGVTGTQSDVHAGLVASEDLTFANLDPLNYYSNWIANSTGHIYPILTSAAYDLPLFLRDMLNARVEYLGYDTVLSNDQLFKMGVGLQNSDIEKAFTGIADTLTNQIRSNDPGDNCNASTVTGRAYFNETYIHVCWRWMTLPIAEVALTTFLLGLSIAMTRKQPLLKDSVTALLVGRLHGWSDDELEVSGLPTQEKLDDLAERIIAKLEVDDGGRLRFVRG
ncbi:hypothetical protein F5Y13DRAFT_158200 [Hypoxylon sp. FL1857]|nr:hypothetical protein F5Y13DRAFT_158200 [Hypoxylon sp. FL1857]